MRFKDEAGDVFHTYSTYAHGLDILLGTYYFLDLTPKGRNEAGSAGGLTGWVKRHDAYDSVEVGATSAVAAGPDPCCHTNRLDDRPEAVDGGDHRFLDFGCCDRAFNRNKALFCATKVIKDSR